VPVCQGTGHLNESDSFNFQGVSAHCFFSFSSDSEYTKVVIMMIIKVKIRCKPLSGILCP
jgi:hypothetical protein